MFLCVWQGTSLLLPGWEHEDMYPKSPTGGGESGSLSSWSGTEFVSSPTFVNSVLGIGVNLFQKDHGRPSFW